MPGGRLTAPITVHIIRRKDPVNLAGYRIIPSESRFRLLHDSVIEPSEFIVKRFYVPVRNTVQI